MSISILELKLKAPKDVKVPQSTGSLLHGLLMENIDSDYAEVLHNQGLRPYSQHIFFDVERQHLCWRIASLNQQAKDEILEAAFALPQKILLKHNDLMFEVISKEYTVNTDYAELAEKYFAHSLSAKGVDFKFVTSCSFKSEGQYVIFPQTYYLLMSLLNKWNTFADKERIDEKGLAKELSEQVFVRDYNLRLQAFSVDGARIPGFRGNFSLGFKNNIMSARIIAMLAEFSCYSGIGIKTALGMGAVQVNLR